MAKISDLPPAGAITGAELMPVVQGGATKLAQFGDMLDQQAELLTEEGAAQVVAIGTAKDAALAELDVKNGVAQSAAVVAAAMVLDPSTAGPGTAMPTTATFGTTVNNTYILSPLFPAGFVFEALDMSVAASGAGAMQLMHTSRNSDGTVNLVDDLTDQVISTTGTSVTIPLKKAGANYVAAVEGRLAFRRALGTTATINYRNAASGQTLLVTGKLAGSNVAASAQVVLPAYRIRGYLPRKGKTLFERSAFNGSGVGYDPFATVAFTQGIRELAAGSTISVTTSVYCDWKPIARSGPLSSFTLPIAAVGAVEMHLLRVVSPGNVRLMKKFYVLATSTGPAVPFVASTDYDSNIEVQKGWFLGAAPQGASLTYGGSGTGGLYIFAQPMYEGVDYAMPTPTAQSISIGYTIASTAMPLSTLVETMGDRLRGQTQITWEFFAGTATPTSWTLGGWTVSNGLVSPATGSNSAVASMATVRWCNRATWTFKFKVSTTSAFKFGFGGTGEANSQYIRLNAVTQKVEICRWEGSGNAPVTRVSFDWLKRNTDGTRSAFATALGAVREYTVTIRRKVNAVYISIADNVNGERFYEHCQSFTNNRIIGQPGFLFEAGSGAAGDITVTEARFSIDVGRNVRAVFFGDSITEASALADWQFPGHAERIEAIRNKGDTLTIARHGANSGNLLAEMLRVLPLLGTVDFVFVLIGANDTVQATLDANIASMISNIVAKGAVPVLCTIPPKTGGLYIQTNTNIRTRVYGNYPCVDTCRALTTANDNVNWNTSLGLAETPMIHPNHLGYAAWISQNTDGAPAGTFACEAPFLFADSLAGYVPMVA